MSLTESQFIRERCLALIRKASTHEDHWEWTILDRMHVVVAGQVSLEEDEFPIVSFCAGPGDWTLMTTHRMVGAAGADRSEIERDDYGTTGFGDFKQDLDSPRVTPAKIGVRGRSSTFLYESGYASMAPIHYFKFWRLKWPAWRETYRLSTRDGKAEPTVPPGGGSAAQPGNSDVTEGPPSVS